MDDIRIRISQSDSQIKIYLDEDEIGYIGHHGVGFDEDWHGRNTFEWTLPKAIEQILYHYIKDFAKKLAGKIVLEEYRFKE